MGASDCDQLEDAKGAVAESAWYGACYWAVRSHLGVTIKTDVPNLGGSIVTAGGLAFIAATTDQYLRAFELQTGKVV